MKKLYSNTLMQLILALCTFSFVACQEFDIDSQPEGPLNIQIDALESYTALGNFSKQCSVQHQLQHSLDD